MSDLEFTINFITFFGIYLLILSVICLCYWRYDINRMKEYYFHDFFDKYENSSEVPLAIVKYCRIGQIRRMYYYVDMYFYKTYIVVKFFDCCYVCSYNEISVKFKYWYGIVQFLNNDLKDLVISKKQYAQIQEAFIRRQNNV